MPKIKDIWKNKELHAILEILLANYPNPVNRREIILYLERVLNKKIYPMWVVRRLNILLQHGLIERVGRGSYKIKRKPHSDIFYKTLLLTQNKFYPHQIMPLEPDDKFLILLYGLNPNFMNKRIEKMTNTLRKDIIEICEKLHLIKQIQMDYFIWLHLAKEKDSEILKEVKKHFGLIRGIICQLYHLADLHELEIMHSVGEDIYLLEYNPTENSSINDDALYNIVNDEIYQDVFLIDALPLPIEKRIKLIHAMIAIAILLKEKFPLQKHGIVAIHTDYCRIPLFGLVEDVFPEKSIEETKKLYKLVTSRKEYISNRLMEILEEIKQKPKEEIKQLVKDKKLYELKKLQELNRIIKCPKCGAILSPKTKTWEKIEDKNEFLKEISYAYNCKNCSWKGIVSFDELDFETVEKYEIHQD